MEGWRTWPLAFAELAALPVEGIRVGPCVPEQKGLEALDVASGLQCFLVDGAHHERV